MGATLDDRVGLSAAERARLAHLLDAHHTLEDVLRWGLAQEPPRLVEDVVVQDEYTHDVVVPWEAGRYLVYDCT
ncbi:MAG: hypothetical protein HY909_00215 [Deltaproteobacteria bacterium]|nr:hypothetical protein [Deltaproteobacteria bacterium]